MICFVCDGAAVHDHHVVPASVLPNGRTVPLCERCHSLVPGHPGSLVRGHSLAHHMREVKRRARGRQVGGTARYGYEWKDGDVVPNEREQAVIAEIVAMRSAAITTTKIAATLNARALRCRGERPWTDTVVAKILHRANAFGAAMDRASLARVPRPRTAKGERR